jgi:hypothetical protein
MPLFRKDSAAGLKKAESALRLQSAHAPAHTPDGEGYVAV